MEEHGLRYISHQKAPLERHSEMFSSSLTQHSLTAFGGAVAAAAVWSIWGGDIFPAEPDPKGNPEEWTREEMRRWLGAVRRLLLPFEVLANT